LNKREINIVWFKSDLSLTDHEPLFMEQQESLPDFNIEKQAADYDKKKNSETCG